MAEAAFKKDLDELVHQIHLLWDDLDKFLSEGKKKANDKRLRIGAALVEAKRRVEDGEGGAIAFWDWYKRNFARSRSDAYQLMSMAASPNPQAARAAEQTRAREGMRATRANRDESVTSSMLQTRKSKPALRVIESKAPPEPVVDHTWCDDVLRQFSRQNLATQNHFIVGLRKAFRQGWK